MTPQELFTLALNPPKSPYRVDPAEPVQQAVLRPTLNYSQIVDEWLKAKQSDPQLGSVSDYAQQQGYKGAPADYSAAVGDDPVQQVGDFLNRIMSTNPSTALYKGAADAGRAFSNLTGANFPTGPDSGIGELEQRAANAQTPGDVKASDVTGQMGRSAGQVIDESGGSEVVNQIRDWLGSNNDNSSGTQFEQSLGAAGESIPQMLSTAPLLATGNPLATAAALVKSGAEAYAPQRNTAAGIISPATLLAGGAAVPLGVQAGERMALNRLFPTAESMVGQTPAELGSTAADMLRTSISPAAKLGLQAARVGGGVAAGTVTNELGRQAQSFADTGKLAPLSPEGLLTDVTSNLAFAGPLMKGAGDPYKAMQTEAIKVLSEGQGLRNQNVATQKAYNDARGQRIADAHQEIFNQVETGGNLLSAIKALKSHWDEAVPEPTQQAGLGIMKSIADDGEFVGISDQTFAQIVASVQGKYTDHFKADNTLPGPETVNTLVQRGLLPKFSKEDVSNIYDSAMKQSLGDPEAAKVYATNALYAQLQERIPGAMEAMRQQKQDEPLTRQALNAQTEADKDATYIQAIIKLYPYMKGAQAPDGTSLAQALYARDAEFSKATQGSQLAASSTAWSKYDAWKNAVIKMADTYDATTRQGSFLPIKRLSDGSVIELPAQKTSLEDMVKKEGGKYQFDVTPTRKIGRSGSASMMRDAVEFVNEKFRPTQQIEEDISNVEDPEAFAAERKGLIRSGADDQLALETNTNAEEDTQGMSAEEKAAYLEANKPALGVELGDKPEPFYDAALHLMNKVDKATNAELWSKYGGERIFGKGAKSPGKMQLFKDAVLARMESEMDDSGQLSIAQKRFYEAWRKNANEKVGDVAPLAKTWEEQRGQFKHAQRLYWGTSNPVSMPDLFMSMLDDKPKYQAMLRKGQVRSKQSLSPLQVDKLAESGGYLDVTTRGEAQWMSKHFGPPSAVHNGVDAFDHNTPMNWINDTTGKTVGRSVGKLQENAEMRQPRVKQSTSTLAQYQQGQAAPSDMSYMYHEGHQAPIVDAMMIGEKFALSQGLPADVAQEMGVVLAKAVQVFDETAGYGTLIAPDPRTMGTNAPSDVLGGPVSSVSLENIAKKVRDPWGAVVKVMSTSMHEFAHNYSSHIPEGMVGYRPQRADAYAKLEALFNELGPDATDDLLNNAIPSVILPPSMQNLPVPTLDPAVVGVRGFGEEAISRLMEHVMLGAMTKDNPMQAQQQGKTDSWGQAVKWLPDEVQATMHLALRDVSNFAGALKQYYRTRPYQKGDLRVMAYIEPMLQFANEYLDTNAPQLAAYRAKAQEIRAKFTEAGVADWTAPVTIKSAYRLDQDALKEINSLARTALSTDKPDDAIEAQQVMFGSPEKFEYEHTKRLGTTVPPWSKYLGLFYQMMRRYGKAGVPLANDVTRMVNDLEPSYFRLTREMHDPFLTRDAKGRLMYDPENPVLRVLQRSDPEAVRARQKINELYLWQNEHGKSVVAGNVDAEGQKKLNETIGGLGLPEQQAVQEGLLRLRAAYTKAADIVYGSQVESTGSRLAALFMSIDKSLPWGQAFATGRQVTEAALGVQSAQSTLKYAQAKEPLLVPQRTQELQQAQVSLQQATQYLDPEIAGAANQYLFGPEGLAQKLLDLNDFLKKRQDWFGSESRPGKVFIVSKMPDGENHYTSAQNEPAAKKVMQELVAAGHTGFQFIDRNQKDSFDLFQSPDAVVENFLKLEDKSWKDFLHNMKEKLSAEDAAYLDGLGYTPGQASEKYLANKAVERYMQKRELHPGRERLDAFEVFRDYSGRMSGSVARRSLQQRMDLLLRDPSIRLDSEFKQQVKEAMSALMTPIDERFVAARAGMTAYFLGVPNLIGPMIEATQSSTTILPYLIDEAGGFKNGVNAYRNALVTPYTLRDLGQTIESKRLLARAGEKESIDPRAMTKEESMALYYKRANDEGSFQYGPIYSATLSRDHSMLTQQAFGLGKSTPKTREQLVTDPLYWAAQKTMYLYSHMSAYNNRIAFLGGLDVSYDKGLRGNELYQAARAFGNLATFGGGKANSIGFTAKLSNPTTRSAFSLIESLQRYTLGQTTMFKDMLADSAGMTDLKPSEKSAARKALTTATLAQWMLAGAVGIPGAAIALAVLKAMTGFDGKQKLREFETHIAKGLGADDEMAVTMANYAQNGLASNFLGVDLSNRVTNNSILGFNQYDGFDVSGVFGATGGMVQRLVDGTKFVAQGQMVQAGKAIAPPSWTPYFDLAQSQRQYGDFALRDKSNRMITPLSKGEAGMYALGLKPQRFRYFKDEQDAVRSSNEQFNQVRDGKLDELSQELLKGNTQATLDHVRKLRAQDPTIQPQSTIEAVINRAVSATHPTDPLAQGAIGNEPALRQIKQSFGQGVQGQSELGLLQAKEGLKAKFGGLAGPQATTKEVQKAQMVDQLVRMKGMVRGEALRMVDMMEKVGMF